MVRYCYIDPASGLRRKVCGPIRDETHMKDSMSGRHDNQIEVGNDFLAGRWGCGLKIESTPFPMQATEVSLPTKNDETQE